MKLTKKKVFVAVLAISLVAIISMGSLAWFSDSDEVTNKFMVATSDDDDPDDIFSVNVYEDPIDGTTGKVEDGLNYTDVLPGDQLVKKAHVENTGYYDQYIRVTVTISDAAVWSTMLGSAFNDDTLRGIFKDFDQSKWTNITTEVYNNGTADNTADDVIRIVMYYNGILYSTGNADADNGKLNDVTIFKGINIPSVMTQAHAVKFDDDGVEGFTIDVVADAVQTKNVGANAYEAFQSVGI